MQYNKNVDHFEILMAIFFGWVILYLMSKNPRYVDNIELY